MLVKEFLFNNKGVEIYQIPNFLTEEECTHFCRKIEQKGRRSEVAGEGDVHSTYSDARTSKSALFGTDDEMVVRINQRMADEVGSWVTHAEQLSGHVYEEGQEFKDHTDFFSQESYVNHCLSSGQRTWTVMVYLNDVEEGGHTEFLEIGKSFAPKKGTAVIWKNADSKDEVNPATLHCGRPVLKGKKFILTKWFREHEFNPQEDARLAKQYHKNHANKQGIFILDKFSNKVKIEYIDGVPNARFARKEDIPAYTATGFKKMPIPKSLYYRILFYYYEGREQARPEFDPNGNDEVNKFISSQEVRYPTEMIWLSDEMKSIIFDQLQDTLSSWSGKELERTYCYGIRSYKRGAQLIKHIDGYTTRIISAILNIDQKVDEPWALQIDDHNGVEHEVYLAPGEMVLYESATLMHGRVKPFNGDYFTNLFVHYIPLS
ncbi:MAG: 2OG-Fe(II) oxygenase [Bacteroidota bacterium]